VDAPTVRRHYMPVVPDKYRGTAHYHLLYRELLTAALYRGTVSNMDVAKIIGITQPGNHMSREVGHILGEIAEDEHNVGRPMLSAVAVRSTGEPGEGFFKLARALELIESDCGEAAQHRFWEQTRDAVYATWRDAANG
jgi:hypothetical protein